MSVILSLLILTLHLTMLESMLIDMVETLDKQEFDLSKSLSEVTEDELK